MDELSRDPLDWTLRQMQAHPNHFAVARIQDPSGENPDTYWSVGVCIVDQYLGRSLWLAQKQERAEALRKRSRQRRATWRRAGAPSAG